jgi:glutathione-regulated potassium-efflux system ancillary protein KefG
MNRILVIYAHPESPPSRANRALREGAQARFAEFGHSQHKTDLAAQTKRADPASLNHLAQPGLAITWHNLYQHYADFHINVRKEQTLLLEHDVLVFQHPLHWYSVPALLKLWIDEVLEDGWAYGGGAAQLAGKRWAHWVTAGGSASAYTRGGQNNFAVEELLRPLEQTAKLCRCLWTSPQFTYSSLTLDDADLQREAQRYALWLEALTGATHSESHHA